MRREEGRWRDEKKIRLIVASGAAAPGRAELLAGRLAGPPVGRRADQHQSPEAHASPNLYRYARVDGDTDRHRYADLHAHSTGHAYPDSTSAADQHARPAHEHTGAHPQAEAASAHAHARTTHGYAHAGLSVRGG